MQHYRSKLSVIVASMLALAIVPANPALAQSEQAQPTFNAGDQAASNTPPGPYSGGVDWLQRWPRTVSLMAEIIQPGDPKINESNINITGSESIIRDESGTTGRNILGAIFNAVQAVPDDNELHGLQTPQSVLVGAHAGAHVFNPKIAFLDGATTTTVEPIGVVIGQTAYAGFANPNGQSGDVKAGVVDTMIGAAASVALDNLGHRLADDIALEYPNLVGQTVGQLVSVSNGFESRNVVGSEEYTTGPFAINAGPVTGILVETKSAEKDGKPILMDAWTGIRVEAPQRQIGSDEDDIQSLQPDIDNIAGPSYGIHITGSEITDPSYVALLAEGPVVAEKSLEVDGATHLNGNTFVNNLMVNGTLSGSPLSVGGYVVVDSDYFWVEIGDTVEGPGLRIDTEAPLVTLYDMGLQAAREITANGPLVSNDSLVTNGSTNIKRTLLTSSTTLGNHHYVACGVKSSAITLTLPSASTVAAGRVLIIKDAAGEAATRSITVAASGSQTIDGAASVTINTNYDSITLIANGATNWELIK